MKNSVVVTKAPRGARRQQDVWLCSWCAFRALRRLTDWLLCAVLYRRTSFSSVKHLAVWAADILSLNSLVAPLQRFLSTFTAAVVTVSFCMSLSHCRLLCVYCLSFRLVVLTSCWMIHVTSCLSVSSIIFHRCVPSACRLCLFLSNKNLSALIFLLVCPLFVSLD